MILPDELPALTPAAARALLHILLDARARAAGELADEHEKEENP